MKSISNSDPIYSGIACQEPIPKFLLISLKYLRLSTFLKVLDLIRSRSLTTAHFLWQDLSDCRCISGTLRSTRNLLLPLPAWQEVERGDSPNQSPLFRVSKQRQEHPRSRRRRVCCLPSLPPRGRGGLLGISPLDLYAVTPQQLEPICMVPELSPRIFAAPPSSLAFLQIGPCFWLLQGPAGGRALTCPCRNKIRHPCVPNLCSFMFKQHSKSL